MIEMTLKQAEKIMAKVVAGKAGKLDPEVVKQAMSLLMQAVMQDWIDKGVSFPPPPPPELPCPWRLSREIQEARLRVPEPSRCDYKVVQYLSPPKTPVDYWRVGEPVKMNPIEKSQFQKKMFCTEDGSRFEAWTADGKNPVFPIPL